MMPLSKRRVIGTAVAVVVAIAVVLFGAGWFYSDEINILDRYMHPRA